jgi:hypothetical protein
MTAAMVAPATTARRTDGHGRTIPRVEMKAKAIAV